MRSRFVLSICFFILSTGNYSFGSDELKSEVYAQLFSMHGGNWNSFQWNPEKHGPTVQFLIDRYNNPQLFFNEVVEHHQPDLKANSLLALSNFFYHPQKNEYDQQIKKLFQNLEDRFDQIELSEQKLILHCYYNSKSPFGLERITAYLIHPNQEIKDRARNLLLSLKDEPSEQDETSLDQQEIVYDFSQNTTEWRKTLKKVRVGIEKSIKTNNITPGPELIKSLNNIGKIQKKYESIISQNEKNENRKNLNTNNIKDFNRTPQSEQNENNLNNNPSKNKFKTSSFTKNPISKLIKSRTPAQSKKSGHFIEENVSILLSIAVGLFLFFLSLLFFFKRQKK